MIAPGATLHDLFAERRPLLERWSDVQIDAAGKGVGELVDEVAASVA